MRSDPRRSRTDLPASEQLARLDKNLFGTAHLLHHGRNEVNPTLHWAEAHHRTVCDGRDAEHAHCKEGEKNPGHKALLQSVRLYIVTALVLFGIAIPAIFLAWYALNQESFEDLITRDVNLRQQALAHVMTMPFVAALFSMVARIYLGISSILVHLVIGASVAMLSVSTSLSLFLNAEYFQYVHTYMCLAVATLALGLCLGGLNLAHELLLFWVWQSEDREAKLLREGSSVWWWWTITLEVSTFGPLTSQGVVTLNEDDAAFSFRTRQSAAGVIHTIAHLFLSLLRGALLVAFLLFYVHTMFAASSLTSEIDGRLLLDILVYVLLAFLTIALVLGILSPAVRSLLNIALSAPLRLGDLISLTTHRRPTTNPAEAIAGFVENFTMYHLVVRDFQGNQVWVPWHEYESLVMHNWSRRPNKPARLEFALHPSSDARAMAKLHSFLWQWIGSHPDVEPSTVRGYRKCELVRVDPSYVFEVICLPRRDKSRNRLRTELILRIAAALPRLGLTIVPLESTVMLPRGAPPDGAGTSALDVDSVILDDLLQPLHPPKPDMGEEEVVEGMEAAEATRARPSASMKSSNCSDDDEHRPILTDFPTDQPLHGGHVD